MMLKRTERSEIIYIFFKQLIRNIIFEFISKQEEMHAIHVRRFIDTSFDMQFLKCLWDTVNIFIFRLKFCCEKKKLNCSTIFYYKIR